jgi:tetratricopeptide (TPR) repeat protein
MMRLLDRIRNIFKKTEAPNQGDTNEYPPRMEPPHTQGGSSEALPLSRPAGSAGRSHLGEALSDYAALLLVYPRMGEKSEVEALLLEVLEISRAAHCDGRRNDIAVLGNLADLYRAGRQYSEAETLYRQALETIRLTLGEANPDYVQCLLGLARLYHARGDHILGTSMGSGRPLVGTELSHARGQYSEAEKLYCGVLETSRSALGEGHPDYARCLLDLAGLYRATNNRAAYAATRSSYGEALGVQRQTLKAMMRDALGKGHRSIAACVDELVTTYDSEGKYAVAEPLVRRALEVYRRGVGEGHPDHATCLRMVALWFFRMRRLTEAQELYRRALKMIRKESGQNHLNYAATLDSLAQLHHRKGEIAKVEPLRIQVIEIIRDVHREDHPLYAHCLRSLAALYLAQGRDAKARTTYRRALDIMRAQAGQDLYRGALEVVRARLGQDLYRRALEVVRAQLGDGLSDYATSLQDQAEFHQLRGDYAAAGTSHYHALEVRRVVLGEDHPDYARCLHDLSAVYVNIGDYGTAESLLRQALEITRATLGQAHPTFTAYLNDLAILYRKKGDLVSSEMAHRQAEGLAPAALVDEQHDPVPYLIDRAIQYCKMKDYAAAEPLLRRALEIEERWRGVGHTGHATCLINLAAVYSHMGNYGAAEPLLRQALEICREVLGERHPDYADCLNNLAAVYEGMGDYGAAEPLLHQALEIHREVLGERHPDYAGCLNNLALSRQAQGKYAEAEPLFRQALEITCAALGEFHQDRLPSLRGLAACLVAQGQAERALALLKQANSTDDLWIGQVSSLGSERQRSVFFDSLLVEREEFLSLVYCHLANSEEAVRSALDLVLRRKAMGVAALAAQRDGVLGGRDPALAPRLRELTALRSQITQRILNGPGMEGVEVHQQLLSEWLARKEQLEAELARQIPEMDLERRLRAADRGAVALSLPVGTALLEFVRFNVFDFHAVPVRGKRVWRPSRHLAFVLHAGRPDEVHMIDLGEAGPIDRLIADFRASIATDPTDRHGRDAIRLRREPVPDGRGDVGVALRHAIFDPLVPSLAACRRLLIAPSGELCRLPFEVLPGADGRRLIDDYRISYLSCGRDVLRLGAPASAQPMPPLVLADPDFDLGGTERQPREQFAPTASRHSRDLVRSGYHFDRLPGTRAEGDHIADLLKIRPWMDGDASEGRLKADCRSPRILHLATHGFFLARVYHVDFENSFPATT